MAKPIQIELTNDSIKAAMKELRRYKKWVTEKEAELRSRLATIGLQAASIRFGNAMYVGTNDVSVRVDSTGSVAVIYAEGNAVAFIEFGAGAKFGYGHPRAGEFGFGPGTYSDGPDGKGYWDNEDGWWYGGQRTYGNPPAMAMYSAVQAITESVTEIAREVFAEV